MTAIAELRARLLSRSGFSAETVTDARLTAHLRARAVELRHSDAEACARFVLATEGEYARCEAVFSPPETWLFRYEQSCEFLRERARTAPRRPIRVLIIGCGGWSEPISIAAALCDGAGRGNVGATVEVLATDRNHDVFAPTPAFTPLQLRAGIPSWAQPYFSKAQDSVAVSDVLTRCVRTRIADASAVMQEELARGNVFDVIAFRNVAIYLDEAVRARIFAGLVKLLDRDGVLLVGHAEVHAAVSATGLTSIDFVGAFALSRESVSTSTATTAAREHDALQAQHAAEPAAMPPARLANAGETTRQLLREPRMATPLEATRAAAAREPLVVVRHLELALALEQAGALEDSWSAVTRALYLDPSCESSLVVAARLASARGFDAEAQRLRMRALRAHLDNTARGERGESDA